MEVSVPAGFVITMSSTVDASVQQRYRIFRRLDTDPKGKIYELPPPVPGGGGAHFEPWDVGSVYRINCEGCWPEQGYNEWLPSRERFREGLPPDVKVIECEDHWSTDGDWNDLIVTITVKKANANARARKSASDDHRKP